ncbi:hypothetical protein N7447_004905 [Penicillium robsamsonii]|uniref:uncharacterized protein n=1 Tax=Penicillium robsamsonii TaxID=1792511 RepID=UPI0025472229|nr:uncharacterized protein N7447_004905 [Penicillium robsamsonii]KAJ5822565.1 hypothetical protein N7447_004905 [Penicillium robsamsonii]
MSSVTAYTDATPVPNPGKDELSILRVHTYDRSAGKLTQERLLQVKSTELQKAKDGTLKELRGVLRAKNVFNSRTISSPFCDKNGSEMDDDILTKTYNNLVGNNNHEATHLQDSQVVPGELSVYYKKQITAMDDATKEFLNKPLDLDLKEGQQLSKADIARLKSAFEAKTWTAAEKKSSSLSHAATLTEKEWDIITRTNCLLSGHKIVEFEKTIGGPIPITPNKPDKPWSKSKIRGRKVKDLKVERTPYNAFALKKRDLKLPSYGAQPLISIPAAQEGGDKLEYPIPRFRVDDDSYVSVYETQNNLEKSLASGSFSENSLEASAGASFWGVSAAAKVGGAWSSQDNDLHATSSESKNMNFPRVTVYLDKDSLEITAECQKDMNAVNTKQQLIDFSNKYGDIFAQRVQLGGVLSASESSTATSTQDKEKHAKAMKISAAVSFSSSFAQASLSASHGGGSNSDTSTTSQDLTSAMAWEATGGDTLYCNNPAQWCGTVGEFYNWRVIDQCDVLPLSKVIDSINGNNKITEKFEQAAKK